MSAAAAELLRIGTVRAPRYLLVGLLAVVGLLAAVPILAPGGGDPPGAREIADGVRGLAMFGVLAVAGFAAATAGTEFKDGAAAASYLATPHRGLSLGGRLAAHAAAGAAVAAVVTAVACGAGSLVAAADGLDVALSGADVLRAVAGSVLAGAVFASAGVLIGTAARNPSLATGALVAWSIGEGVLRAAGVGEQLPFGLVDALVGLDDAVPLVTATALLVAYLTVLAGGVWRWALPRDLT